MEERSISDRLFELLTTVEETYNTTVEWLRNYTPYVVRAIEIVLALGLLILLAQWYHTVYIVGA
ncbi:hypothetical protein AArcSl_1070 [Halalkaliarchaeum desulfuricum]|uniref:Uncharacterized protein n=1 Tax=Halalkaliarchaeum desulfuricum TaxID=2055893 RepID=A0A343THY3_9EURY|nr:hypothetical protein [Halalkaliarchaeum desulfuricum]AUX08705.1 hypothetical protein AArcSl_1070 [Halalkaliarchaeum desulfuricum]